jgi:hypothetical protein
MYSTSASYSGYISFHYMRRLQACQTGTAVLFGQPRQALQGGVDHRLPAGSTPGTSLTIRGVGWISRNPDAWVCGLPLQLSCPKPT